MKKFLLGSTLVIAALTAPGQAAAQDYVPFDMYGFMTKSDVSYNTPQAQQYVVSKMIYTVDSSSPYFLQKQTAAFSTKVDIDNQWVKVSACYVRDGKMYAVRHLTNSEMSRISTYDEKGNETFVMNVPATNGYIAHTAYVEDEDMLYMVLFTPRSTTADLYKAPGENPADMTHVATFCNSFMEKPFSFTYVHEKDLFFYVSNGAKLYSLSRTGEREYYYNISPDGAHLPSDGSDGGESSYADDCSGLVWSAPYNMLIWICPRGAIAGSGLTYWYGLDLVKDSEYREVHNLINHVDSGLSTNYYNCMVNEGISLSGGLPPAPTYVSVYPVNSKPGYYDVSWNAVKNDINGDPIEGEVSYNVYVGDNLIAKKAQPAKGVTVGVRFLLPHAYTADTFYVGVETVTEWGTSDMKVEGPFTSVWDPDDAGGWYGDDSGVKKLIGSETSVTVSGNRVSVAGLEGETADIVSADGKSVCSLSRDATVELPSGLYIVRAGSETVKILVR